MRYFIKKTNKKRAFSLVEILITILIISILMVIASPILTKRSKNTQTEGIVYTYRSDNVTTDDKRCYATVANYTTPSNESYVETKNCSKYTFTVPEGVTNVNVTLVAGGGGGGGAAGGKLVKTDMIVTGDGTTKLTASKADGFLLDILKGIRINFMAGAGKDGNEGCSISETDSSKTCSSGTAVKAGTGGDSSPYIMNFDVPYEYIKGLDYKSVLKPNSDVPGYLIAMAECDNATHVGCARVVFGTNNAEGTGKAGGNIAYRINHTNVVAGRSYGCAIGSTEYLYGIFADDDDLATAINEVNNYTPSTDVARNCKIPRTSLFVPNPGSEGDFLKNYSTTTNNRLLATVSSHLNGGAGGETPALFKQYGTGGKGISKDVVKCTVAAATDYTKIGAQRCTPQNAVYANLKEDNENIGRLPVTSVTYTVEHPGGTGAGGAAGAVFRVKNLAVKSGETYDVYVGAGGEGGVPGVASLDPTNTVNGGKNGFGGVSTAIFHSKGGLIYMVNGGAGGGGGKVVSSVPKVNTAYFGDMGSPGANIHRVFHGNNLNYDNIDSSISFISTTNTSTGTAGDYTSSGNLLYKKLEEEPYATFSNNKVNTGSTHVAELYSSFSDFLRTGNPKKISGKGYDGLYFRMITENTVSYIGGLGAHSGLGGRAGCGGYFMGNFDGRTTQGNPVNLSDIDPSLINSVIFSNGSYNILNYYENCNSRNSNGSGAKIVLPNISPRDYGQAGGGGGGGGYNVLNGPGKGGSGQDGYVMIDWRK